MSYDASDRKAIRRAEKLAAIRERDEAEFIVAAMGTKQGRTWFHQHLANCHIFQTTFCADALGGAFNEGARAVGLRAYGDIMRHCPAHFVTMMQEAHIQEQTNERRAQPDASPEPDPNDDGAYFDPDAGGSSAQH